MACSHDHLKKVAFLLEADWKTDLSEVRRRIDVIRRDVKFLCLADISTGLKITTCNHASEAPSAHFRLRYEVRNATILGLVTTSVFQRKTRTYKLKSELAPNCLLDRLNWGILTWTFPGFAIDLWR